MARRLLKEFPSTEPVNPERDKLLALAYRTGDSTSNAEDRILDKHIEDFCNAALAKGDDSDIEAALAVLKSEEGTNYDDLLSIAEGCAEFYRDKNGAHLLVLVPVLAWSRYGIAFGKMPEVIAKSIADLYKTYFAGVDARVTVGNTLISAEHIPERLVAVRHLLAVLSKPKTHGAVVDTSFLLTASPADEFSDARYVPLAVSAPSEAMLFTPAEKDRISRARDFMDFALKAREVLRYFTVGSFIEVQYPSAFFSAWRQAAVAERLFSLKALVSYVCVGKTTPEDLVATTAIFSIVSEGASRETQPEVRIGISLSWAPEKIIAGIVWPCDPNELEIAQSFAGEVLTMQGVPTVVAHSQLFPMEWCEQCGAPLYANPDGLVIHAERPDSPRGDFTPTLN